MVLESAYGPNCIMTQLGPLGPLGPQFTHTHIFLLPLSMHIHNYRRCTFYVRALHRFAPHPINNDRSLKPEDHPLAFPIAIPSVSLGSGHYLRVGGRCKSENQPH